MQGFILHTQKVKDEDLLVCILSKTSIIRTYRFYGLRHSTILSGYKIDFALEDNPRFLPRLKDVLHLGFQWILHREKMFLWQEFIRLLYAHLKELGEIDEFYFELVNESAKRFEKQNPKRVILDSYLQILEFEGRLHKEFSCFLCDEKIKGDITLVRAFLPSHKPCVFGLELNRIKLENFYESKNCAIFNDEEIEKMYMLVKEGL
ncbi:recombination protein RecO [Campylobacter sp. MIT 21-1685]|uniref:recombination protein RecO n=1 Tax=unclassified Campylobacter TaxID=2593542 RepID=UPI00224AA787|nr:MULTISPECIES: recombination protein RecO [unclassified Campylobacter]MCX2683661.1 recombination protein RecO [Campylobacter sp. MIT 21-1684]MCX2751937.1 recombination protein RecO [Campylobacter sp. MIT 21-1682]MCX2808138.1 recombination protein RecO [Campylobacter sp. MIT 21-1685]